jgi:hypothetical protein
MQTIDNASLLTITGGAARANSSSIDAKTEQLLTKLASDVKDLAKAPQTNQTQQLLTMVMMSKLAQR